MPNASNTARVRGAIGGEDVTATRAIIAVQGPRARERLATVSPEAAAVPRFGVARVAMAGHRHDRRRHRLHGRRRRRVAVPVEAAAAASGGQRSRRASSPPGSAHATPSGSRRGCPLHGHELGPGITPLQAGLGWVVAWAKPSFRGRDALAAEKERGVSTRRLRGLRVEGRRPPRAEQAILVGGRAVGVVTSGNFSPMLQCGIALGFVPPTVEIGDTVEIDVRGDRMPAEVVKTPFVSR